MYDRAIPVAVSALVGLVCGYLLWPPGDVYWTDVADAVGVPATMVAVLVFAGLVGVGLATASPFSLVDIGLGWTLAYIVGIALVDALTTPDSPVHLLLYGALLCAGLLAALGTRWARNELSVPE